MYSLIIPVYMNEGSIPELVEVCEELNRSLGGRLQVVFVVDGSPDASAAILEEKLPACGFRSRLILLSRNFGPFAAMREGLIHADGTYFAAMAADLQEPPELMLRFFETLEAGKADVTLGSRESRNDPLVSRLASNVFWGLYRRLVQPEMPPGGVDVFGCNRAFRDHLLSLGESNTTLVGLLFWMGFRRELIGYERRERRHGKSAWSFSRKLRYLMDSVFAFSDLPIRLLILAGTLGMAISVVFSAAVLVARTLGTIHVPGYAATILVITFFAALNSFGLGIIGSYVWRAFENTKGRPQALIMSSRDFGKSDA